MARIVCIGEAMLELTNEPAGWAMGYGGDTLNTAIHLAREGHDVAYVTALGEDTFSHDLRKKWAAEGIDCSLIMTHPIRQPGLYAISTDASGERSFTYWRGSSAAREMFSLDGIQHTLQVAERADLLYFSLISLAILPADDRQRLLGLASCVSASGGKIAFDGNYRPRLWTSVDEARTARDAAIALADIGLPTFEDEGALSDANTADEVFAHWQSIGCKEVVVKLGAKGCRLPDGRILAPEQVLQPVDTSGAGDAFNAGYLSERLQGASPCQAAQSGHTLAGWTIMRPGAIPPMES